MKIAYLYNRPVSEGEAMGCDKTFADWTGTNRAELGMMIEGGGVRDGDTLRLRAESDLGRGQEAKRHSKHLSQMGVTLEIMPPIKPVKQMGRPKRFAPTPDQKAHLCALWYSPAPIEHVLQRASGIMGQEVKRDKLYYICGPRDGSSAKEASTDATGI
jgi:hypothetical protein